MALVARVVRLPALLGMLALAGLVLAALARPHSAGAAGSSFGAATVTDNRFVADRVNAILKHNVPNLRVFVDGVFRDANFKSHYDVNGGLERWGLPISEVFEEESGALTQYYQRGAVDFHKRNDLGGTWVLERRLTWDYMGGGARGSVDQGVESQVTNPNPGRSEGPWGHKVSDVDVKGTSTGFLQFFDRLGGVESFGFPKTDARLDTGASGTLLAQGATPGIVRQYFQAGVFEHFPNNPANYRVQLTLLGDFLRDKTYPNNRWATLSPFLAAPELTVGASMTIVAVEAAALTPASTATPVGPTATPTTVAGAPLNTSKELIVMGTRTKGVSVFDGAAWRTVNVDNSLLTSNRINAVAVDSQRRIWVGSGSGLVRLNVDLTVGAQFRTDDSGIGDNNVSAVAGAGGSTTWIGFADRGVSSYTPSQTTSTWKWFRTDSSSLPSNSVRDLYIVDVGLNRVWMATSNGAARYDGSTDSWEVLKTGSGLVSNDLMAVAIGPTGTLWFGTSNSGLSSTPSGAAGSWTTYTTSDGLGSNSVRDVFIAADGTVWVATGGGVSRKEALSFSTFNTANSGLVSNDVRAIAQDSTGRLWFATASGVSMYDPATRAWTTYRAEQGLAENDLISIVVVPKA